MRMNSRLREANQSDVIKWFEKNVVELTVYQKERLRDDEAFRWGPLYFYYRKEQEPTKFLWRLTYPIFMVYFIMMWLMLPVFFLVTGRWIYPQWLLNRIHYPWCRKLNLDL